MVLSDLWKRKNLKMKYLISNKLNHITEPWKRRSESQLSQEVS